MTTPSPLVSPHSSVFIRLASGQAVGLAAGLLVAIVIFALLCAVLKDTRFFRALRAAFSACCFGHPLEAKVVELESSSGSRTGLKEKASFSPPLWLHYCLPCHVCGKILTDPVATETCHHVFCRPCLTPSVKSVAKCPLCDMQTHGIVESETEGLTWLQQTHVQSIVVPEDSVLCACCRVNPVGIYTACGHFVCVKCTRRSLEADRGCPVCRGALSLGGLTVLPPPVTK